MLNYAGDVSPRQCWEALNEAGPAAALIDVRSDLEWTSVGVPETGDGMQETIFHQWTPIHDRRAGDDFAASLQSKLS